MKDWILTAAALTSLCLPALAADLPGRAVPFIAPISTTANDGWTGAYVGLGTGPSVTRDRGNASGSIQYYNNVNIYGQGDTGIAGRGAGLTGNAAIGVNRRIDKFVLGGFADLSIADGDAYSQTPIRSWCNNVYNSSCVNSLSATLGSKYRIGPAVHVGLRAGLLVTDTVLAYGLVGAAGANIKSEVSVNVSNYQASDSVTTRGEGWRTGLLLGAGIESKLSDTVSVRAEYRFTRFRSLAVEYDSGAALDPHFYVTKQSVTPGESTILLSLDYRFFSF